MTSWYPHESEECTEAFDWTGIVNLHHWATRAACGAGQAGLAPERTIVDGGIPGTECHPGRVLLPLCRQGARECRRELDMLECLTWRNSQQDLLHLTAHALPDAILDAQRNPVWQALEMTDDLSSQYLVRVNIATQLLDQRFDSAGKMLGVIPLKQISRGPDCTRTQGEAQLVADRGMVPKSFESAAISRPSLCSNRSTLTWQLTSQTPLSAST